MGSAVAKPRRPRMAWTGHFHRTRSATACQERHRLRACPHAELAEDVRHVAVHGVLAPVERPRDLAVRSALREKLQHLALAGGERRERRRTARRLRHPADRALRQRRQPLEKAGHFPEQRVAIADERPVVLSFQLDELRAGDTARDVAAFGHLRVAILAPVQDQRRRGHVRQGRGGVDLGVVAEQGERSARARALPGVRGKPRREAGIVRPARHQRRDLHGPAPRALHIRAEPRPRFVGGCPGIIRRAPALREAAVRDETQRALGIVGGEEDRERDTF